MDLDAYRARAQAFATDLDGFPAAWAPLSVVAPITEASAEYQAIAYALTAHDSIRPPP